MPGEVAAKPKAAERIQEAARELFERQGIRATGVEEVCRVAGATKMSLYRAYPSKDALIFAIVRPGVWLCGGDGEIMGLRTASSLPSLMSSTATVDVSPNVSSSWR